MTNRGDNRGGQEAQFQIQRRLGPANGGLAQGVISFHSISHMTKTYAQYIKQIELLKADAEKARRKEVQGVVGRIREAIDAYGLTAEDLGFAGKGKSAGKVVPAKKRGAKVKAKAKPAAVVKFRNDSGGTWGGRGKRPQWLRDALAAGKTLADFAVK
jgi:DNA-binding protein H-NS